MENNPIHRAGLASGTRIIYSLRNTSLVSICLGDRGIICFEGVWSAVDLIMGNLREVVAITDSYYRSQAIGSLRLRVRGSRGVGSLHITVTDESLARPRQIISVVA